MTKSGTRAERVKKKKARPKLGSDWRRRARQNVESRDVAFKAVTTLNNAMKRGRHGNIEKDVYDKIESG